MEDLGSFVAWFWISLFVSTVSAIWWFVVARRRETWLRWTEAEAAFWRPVKLPTATIESMRRKEESKGYVYFIGAICIVWLLLMVANAASYVFFRTHQPGRDQYLLRRAKPTRIGPDIVVSRSRPVGSETKRSAPISVAFLGYTNGPPATDIMPSLGHTIEALFEVTNHGTTRVTYQLTVDGFRPGGSTPETSHSSPGWLAGHAAEVVRVFAPRGSNQWRFVVVLSTPANDVVYRPVTNEWRTPRIYDLSCRVG
jgi:hypothetical protein